jgi:hypothetical protein
VPQQLELPTPDTTPNEDAIRGAAFRRVQRIGKELLALPQAGLPLPEWNAASADLRTSLADARAAYSIACGVPMGDIDPATGNEHSARIYNALRKSWQRSYDRTLAGYLGWDLDELMQVAETARREFIAKRPDLDDGMPWITGH